MIDTLRPIVAEVEKLGLLDRAYIYGFDENPVSCEPQVRKLFGATKAAFPALRTAAVLNWSPMPVDLPVDIWILQYQEFDAENARAWIKAGKLQWQYHCVEPHSLAYLNTFIERAGMQACVYVCMRICMHACIHVCVCMYVCMHVCLYACTYVYVYACVYAGAVVILAVGPEPSAARRTDGLALLCREPVAAVR